MAANGIHFYRVGNVVLPVGFRFRPTGEELICYYLQINLKGMDNVFSDVIPEINICDHEPRDLPGLSLIKSDDQEWYFFSTYKKTSKNQTKRMTNEGFWKVTGERKQVKTEDKRSVIGEKRILTFYGGQSRDSQKTDWVMHEYYIPKTNPNDNQRDLVVCCVKKKSGENGNAANCDEHESSTYNNNASDFENQQLLPPRMDIDEEHTQQQQSTDYFERVQCRMLASAHGNNDYHGLQSAFAANEWDGLQELLNSFGDQDAQEMSLEMFSEPPVDSSHPRRQEGVMLYQKQAASPVNVVPNQLVTDEHSGTHQRTSRPQRESRHINALNVKNASSVDVDVELPQINCSQLAPEEYHNNERTRRRTYPTSALEALSKQKELKQQQSKAKEVAEHRAAVDFPPKKTSITESNKEAEVAQGNNAEKGMKQTQQQQSMDFFEGEMRRMLRTLSKQKELKQQQSKAKEVAEHRAAVDFPPKKTSIIESNKEAEVAQGNNAEKGMKQTQQQQSMDFFEGEMRRMLRTLSKQKELKQQQSKAKEVAEHRAAVDFPPKKTSIIESNKEAEVAQGNNAEKGMKQTQQQQSMDFFEGEMRRMLRTLSKQKELKQQQSKAKEVAEHRAAVDFPPKKTSITESNKEAEVAQGNNAKKGMKQTQNATTAGNWKGCSFISCETLSKKISQLIK